MRNTFEAKIYGWISSFNITIMNNQSKLLLVLNNNFQSIRSKLQIITQLTFFLLVSSILLKVSNKSFLPRNFLYQNIPFWRSIFMKFVRNRKQYWFPCIVKLISLRFDLFTWVFHTRSEISLRSFWPKWKIDRSEFHFGGIM